MKIILSKRDAYRNVIAFVDDANFYTIGKNSEE